MRQRHDHPKAAMTIKYPRRNHIRIVWLAVLCMMVMGAFCNPANAQFNGPSLGINTPVNPPVVITTDPAILHPAPRDFRFDTGDLLIVRLYGSQDYTPTVRVSLDGSIQLPLIGSVHIAGLTLHQGQDLVAQRLVSSGMYNDPQVAIQIIEAPNQIATVIGEVHGSVSIIGEKRLLDVLATVGGGGGMGGSSPTTVVVGGGGLPTTASHVITINRPGVPQAINVDLGTDPAKSAQADIPIFAGDTIIVSRVGVVYLLGAFKIQGAIPLQQNSPMTLMKVAALAGGPGFEGKFKDLRIIRTVGFDRQVVHIDIKKVINGEAPDPVLQSEDIVFLPSSPMKAAIKSGGIATILGIASVLLYATSQ